MSTEHYLQVPKKSSGTRIDKFIALNIPELSRSMVKKLIQNSCITKDKKVVTDSSFTLKEGDTLVINVPPPVESQMLPAEIPLSIIYEDEEFLVIDKQAGLTVHPGAGNYGDTLANALLAHCKGSLSGIGGVMRPGIVHRLDKDTSGLILAAKTDRSHHSLAKQIASRSLKRTYLAVCWGVPKPLIGSVSGNIGRSEKNRKKMTVVNSGGKEAVTHYSVKEIFGKGVASLVECRLETGRTHQIRVHMSHIGHPIIGDQVYCGRRSGTLKTLSPQLNDFLIAFKRQALHSHKIMLKHPVTGEILNFSSEIHQDIGNLIMLLQKSTQEILS